MYTSAICGYCAAAKTFLKSQGLAWREVRVDLDAGERQRMVERARRTSVPQIFVGQTHVGGYDDMMALHRQGGFLPLVEGAAR
ncbi:glutaredoxin 3 [Luteimonas sp. FCS-9]|uniref:glutaredoxin 3 n=1 Tax=Luteimonas sp. FCS-9 TaxID=1547516 RepID=UPI001E4A4863|nr:glutaredoxin 3 [Luteimonas sp. FCS-9]